MAGLLRNFLTVLVALFKYGDASPLERVAIRFRITPLDTGFSKLKSDKYLHLVEAAQVDFLLKTGWLGIFLRNRYSFVNLSQLVKFSAPINLFSLVDVTSQIIYWDSRSVYFEHVFLMHGKKYACVLVKTKFKHGSKTVEPAALLGSCGNDKPQYLNDWDHAINAM
jgi:acyl-CoA thioesterase FadM